MPWTIVVNFSAFSEIFQTFNLTSSTINLNLDLLKRTQLEFKTVHMPLKKCSSIYDNICLISSILLANKKVDFRKFSAQCIDVVK